MTAREMVSGSTPPRPVSLIVPDMVMEPAAVASLSDAERALVDHVTRGETLDFAGDEPIDEASMRSWDGSRTIPAAIVRDVLRGRLVSDPDPRGLRLRGARIAGRLDIENVVSSVALELYECFLDEGLVARDATLPFLVLSGCRLEHPSESPVDAERLATTVLAIDGAIITGDCETGLLDLRGGRIGELDGSGASLRNDSGPALSADGLQIDQDVFLNDGFEAVGAGEGGAIRLTGARIGGQLGCSRAKLRNDSGRALSADGLQIDQHLFLNDGFEAVGAGEGGAIRLTGARIGAQLGCSGASLHNDSGPALNADVMQVDQDVFLNDGFEAVGAGEGGAVRLTGARIGAQLGCSGASLHNDSGPALSGDGLQVDQHVFLNDGFEAVGAGEGGAIRIMSAHFGIRLDCNGASLRNDSGPALAADGLQVGQVVFLRAGFKAVGAGEHGTVRLLGARIRIQLDCSGARLRNDSGPAFAAGRLQVDQDVFLTDGFEALGAGYVTVDLTGARIGGTLEFDPARLENATDPQALIGVNGLTYSGLPAGVTSDRWLSLLRDGTPYYAAQPYQQLASAHRAAGHDADVRKVLMAQRRDQIHRAELTGRLERAWARLTGVTLGYGYQPWRAVLALLAVVSAAVILAVTVGGQGGLARTDPPNPAAVSCSTIERVGVGLDLGLPLINTGTRDPCDITHTSEGQVLTVAGWGLQLLAWAFATLFIAGFTGAVRKT